jgi:uncharacterized membrane protein
LILPRTLRRFALLAAALVCGVAPARAAEPLGDVGMEAVIKTVTLHLAWFAEGAAALVIGIASARALWAYFANVARPGGRAVPKDEIRLSLGRSLALALEFELGADILKTAVAPTWNEIGQLAAIAVLRTALNYFLERELESAQQRRPEAAHRMGDAP